MQQLAQQLQASGTATRVAQERCQAAERALHNNQRVVAQLKQRCGDSEASLSRAADALLSIQSLGTKPSTTLAAHGAVLSGSGTVAASAGAAVVEASSRRVRELQSIIQGQEDEIVALQRDLVHRDQQIETLQVHTKRLADQNAQLQSVVESMKLRLRLSTGQHVSASNMPVADAVPGPSADVDAELARLRQTLHVLRSADQDDSSTQGFADTARSSSRDQIPTTAYTAAQQHAAGGSGSEPWWLQDV